MDLYTRHGFIILRGIITIEKSLRFLLLFALFYSSPSSKSFLQFVWKSFSHVSGDIFPDVAWLFIHLEESKIPGPKALFSVLPLVPLLHCAASSFPGLGRISGLASHQYFPL